MWLMIGRLKLSIIFIVILVAIIASAYLVRSCRGNEATVYVDDKIDITPTQVLAMKEIGEWEFLSIENEEMIDTVRKGFFKDDELIRIYYGTLRLGFDMSEAKADWIKADKDTLVITLPKIKLLDENFIDEARTNRSSSRAHGATRTEPTCISAPMQNEGKMPYKRKYRKRTGQRQKAVYADAEGNGL